jgi:triosephosphate isomerase
MRQNFVAGNWKMNLTLPEAQALTSEIVQMLHDELTGPRPQVVICPPFPLLMGVHRLLGDSGNPALGAQNFHQKESGAYTGEVSAKQLRSVGCDYVILGHSERRQHFREDDTLLVEKLNTALAAGLKPIFCVGESLETREADETFDFIGQQLANGIFQEVHAFIRGQVAAAYDQATADNMTILYGGSANAQNARELFSQPDVDGGLIGGASLKSRDFVEIVKSF